MLLMIASPLMRLFFERLNQSAALSKRIARGIAPTHSVEWNLRRAGVTRPSPHLVSAITKNYFRKLPASGCRSSGQRRRSKTNDQSNAVVNPFLIGGWPPVTNPIGRHSMSKRIAFLSAAAFSVLAITSTFVAPARAEEKTVMVGGAAMYPSKNIIQNAVNSKDHTTLVAAVKAAGLVETLEGKGPFTVFAPTNAAFGKLPAGTVDSLVKPENKATLTKILTYHVVAGKLDAADLTDGKKLKTVEGEELTVKKSDGKTWIIDAKGDQSMVSITNVHQSNGVIHVVDTVLLPAS
jgi:uncharacterized surface protein with fasciclin (FAS1) repeats